MASRKVVMSDKIYKARVPLSHAVKVGNILFCSGMTPFSKDRELAPDFAGQMHRCMKNLIAVLEEGGSSLDRVAKVTVFLTRMSDFAEMNEIYKTYFKEGNYPARTTIESQLAPNTNMLLEIETVAECDA